MRRKKKPNQAVEAMPQTPETETPSLMDTNPATTAFIPEMYTRHQSYYVDSVGDATAQSVMMLSRPNIYLKLTNGGFIDPVQAAGQKPTNFCVWYHSEIDSDVHSELFQRLDMTVRRRIIYDETKVSQYLVSMANMIAKYYSIVSLFTSHTSNVGTLGDLHDALPGFLQQMIDPVTADTSYFISSSNPLSSIITETKAWIDMVAENIEMFAFPPLWQAEIAEVYSAHRIGPFEDSPIGCFVPNVAGGSAPLVGSGKPLNLLNILPTIRSLRQQIVQLRSDTFHLKISADLQSGPGMPRVSLPRAVPISGFSMNWFDLWTNNGWLHDDANTLNPNDSIVPNASSNDEGKRYTLPFDFVTTPSDMLMSNLTFGLGDQMSGVRGFHLSNIHIPDTAKNPNTGEELDASNQALHALVWAGDDPSASGGVYRADARIDFGGVAADAAAAGTKAKQIARGTMLANGTLGWARVYQMTNATTTGDQYEGFHQEQPVVGRRFYADPFTIQANVYDRYRTLIGLK